MGAWPLCVICCSGDFKLHFLSIKYSKKFLKQHMLEWWSIILQVKDSINILMARYFHCMPKFTDNILLVDHIN